MQFRKVQALRGPNVWANFPVLEVWIDLGELKDSSSDAMPGFNDRLMGWLPTLHEHRCSVGKPGGFFERLRRGTYLAHILEHVAIELQSLAGTPVGYGKTRQANDDGVYKVAVEYQEEELGRAALETGRRLCLAAARNADFDLAGELEALRKLAKQVALPAGTSAIVEAARERKIPTLLLDNKGLLQLGHGIHQCRVLDGRADTAGAVAEAIALDNERAWNLLYNAGLPVPDGRAVYSAADAWQAAVELDAPVVIKPQSGKRRRGTGWNLTAPEMIQIAYEAAASQGGSVLVERFVDGADWRLLVVGEQVIAASRREFGKAFEPVDVSALHPDVAARAVDAADVLGLTIAGVDMVARDLRHPLEEQDGVIVAVSSRPDLSTHIRTPESGKKIGQAVVSEMFPAGQTGRVPIVGITGTNGKTTTTRMVAHILSRVYRKVGMTCTEGIFVGGRRVATGDCSGPQSARAVLQHPRVDAAVLETARGGMLRAGLGFDRSDVGIVTNVGEGDHLGASEVDTPEQLAYVKSIIVAAVAPEGAAILNAEDPLVVGMAKYCRGKIVYFSKSPNHPVVTEHRANGGRAVFVRDRFIVLAEGGNEHPLVSLERVPITHAGRIAFQVENALASAAAAWCLKVPLTDVRLGLESFQADLAKDPGRFNLFRINGAVVILDYGHNADALLALLGSLDHFPQRRRVVVYSSSGDRRDVDLVRQGEILGNGFDRVILYEDPRYLRGRSEGGITGLLRTGLMKGKRMREIEEVRSWDKAAGVALQSVGEGELLVLQPDVIDEAVEFIDQYIQSGSGQEIGLEEALDEPAPQPDEVIYPVYNYGVEVRPCSVGRGAFATRAFDKGECLLRAWGERTTHRLRETMQIDHHEHIIPPSPLVFLNHSCEPNCGALIRRGVSEVAVHALRPLQAGEELTFDYSTFESHVQHIGGPCQCGTPSCRGRVAGYESLPQKQREAYGIYIAEYLRETMPATTVRIPHEEGVLAAQV